MRNSARFTARAVAAALIGTGIFAAHPAAADSALGLRLSTQGLGVEYSKAFVNSFAIRGGLNFFPTLTPSPSKAGIKYDANFKPRSANLFADFYPVGGPFRISAGLVIDKTKINAVAVSVPSLTIGGQSFTAAEYGTLNVSMRYRDVNPYVGIGIGNPYAGLKWGFTFEAGAYLLDPRVRMSSTGGTLSNDPMLLSELESERTQLENTVDNLPVWPVIGVTFTHRF